MQPVRQAHCCGCVAAESESGEAWRAHALSQSLCVFPRTKAVGGLTGHHMSPFSLSCSGEARGANYHPNSSTCVRVYMCALELINWDQIE